MGMRWVESDKRRIAFKRLIAPLTWFQKDAGLKDAYSFKAHATKPNVIIGYWAEDGNEYEITCPPQLRPAILAVLNNLK